jgi:hypothetical protein
VDSIGSTSESSKVTSVGREETERESLLLKYGYKETVGVDIDVGICTVCGESDGNDCRGFLSSLVLGGGATGPSFSMLSESPSAFS